MSSSPIIIFTYNRIFHTRRLLNSISNCKKFSKSKIFIFSDGYKRKILTDKKKVLEVRRELKKFSKKNKNVVLLFQKKNVGLYQNLTRGISKILQEYSDAIIVEDDLTLDENFFIFMNKSLSTYKKNKKILQVTGYSYPIKCNNNSAYFLNLTSCWGWGIWSDRWFDFIKFTQDKDLVYGIYKKISSDKSLKNRFNLNGSFNYLHLLKKQINSDFNSWGVLFYLFSFYKNYLNLFPPYSLVRNTGFDGSGAHRSTSDIFNITVNKSQKKIVYPKKLKKNDTNLKKITLFLNKELNFISKIVNFFNEKVN